MKRKYLIISVLTLLFLTLSAILLVVTAETKEYKLPDMVSFQTEYGDFQTGGSIRMEDLEKYRIVYDKNFTEEELTLVYELGDVIRENTGISLKICSTAEGKREDTYTVSKHELLLGFTYRPEYEYLREQTWSGAASCTMIGKKLVLAIGGRADTVQILNRFIGLIENNCKTNSEFFFSDSDAFIDTGAAPIPSLSLNGLPITDYTIVNPVKKDSHYYQDSAFLSKVLRQRIGELCGYLLPVQNAEDGKVTTAGILRIGVEPTFDSLLNDIVNPSAETAFWNLTAEGNVVCITGTASNCTAKALNTFITRLTPAAPTEAFAVQIDAEEPVPMETDITLMRIDMMGQWPSSTILQEDVLRECPDIFVLENAEDSVGYSVLGDFDGYYTRKNFGVHCDVWFCSERFYVMDEGDIRLPENADWDSTLRSHYVVLQDQMTLEEVVVFTSDVTENTLEEFEKTVQYLCFPERDMICLGNEIPEDAAVLFADASARNGDSVIQTLVTDGLRIAAYADYTEEMRSHHQNNTIFWHDLGEAHILRLEYVND